MTCHVFTETIIGTWICVCGYTRDMIIYSRFHQVRSGVLQPEGVEICPYGLTHYFGYCLLQLLVLPY